MKAKTIAKNFGFELEEEPISIYPFSPVYRLKRPEGDFIVKKTQHPIQKANRLMKYTKTINKQGIEVIIPAKIPVENPRTFDEETYVVYPFIHGESYIGKDWEIQEAGRLLGRIHALSPVNNEFELDIYNVFDFTEEEVTESFQHIVQNAAPHGITINPKLEVRLLQAVRQQAELKQADLISVATPHDFKANNLVYTPKPYLIDPDNAGWVPRIFDLALVLLLFHNELVSAPDRPFTKQQWHLFLLGYGEFVILSQVEKANWLKALEHVFLDEVVWLMADVEEDWQNSVQRTLFENLIQLFLDFEEYSLT
ncbi:MULTISPECIES: aminoglycoside phosphotransferase family protein [Planococcus]|uniref:Serine kinase n=1 Tax=Planococcus faecalis TaxID=1598147 RepID=A0ABM6IRR3_9BACL|nr:MULTISPECIES: aminoglycoside phosphotransferase family protein [Planococcus]AQU79279.1 serine kinase [Planococcus faecalis]MDJ0333367.1 aminoglycoside phosphotransferase family protein [Planococcus sp. S3-L1]OHX52313.1 serine kinase [Planococcus faecalis]